MTTVVVFLVVAIRTTSSRRAEARCQLRTTSFSLVCPLLQPLVHTQNQNNIINKKTKTLKTLDGGSLGSSVDEERGQPRELMRIAGLSEHRHLERTLRPRDPLSRGPVRSRGGKLHVLSHLLGNISPSPRVKPSTIAWWKPGRRRLCKRPSSPALQTAESLSS